MNLQYPAALRRGFFIGNRYFEILKETNMKKQVFGIATMMAIMALASCATQMQEGDFP